MAESTIKGSWNGLIVTHANVIKINVYFEDVGGELKGRFEAPDATQMPTKGDLKILLDGTKLTMVTSVATDTVWFKGEVVPGVSGPHMIHGLILDPKFALLAGSLTLFAHHKQLGDISGLPLMYRGTEPSE